MGNLIPRLKAIIGSLKPLAAIVAILAVILLALFGNDLLTAVRNLDGPQTVTIGQLVKGEVGRGQYVTVSGGALLACLATFLFPSTVFAPRRSAEMTAPPGEIRDIKVSGEFQKLKSVKPTIEVGKGSRKLTKAVANLVPMGEGRLMVYIHHIMRVKSYGITVSRKETDWAVFLEPDKVDMVQPGTLYGWKNRPALQVRYRDPRGKAQKLIISSDEAEALAGSVDLLRRLGFSVRQGA